MTHEEIVKEFRKIEKYLQGRAKDLTKKYGEKPEFENEMDEWHFELLMQVCKTVKESEGAQGSYIEVRTSRKGWADCPTFNVAI